MRWGIYSTFIYSEEWSSRERDSKMKGSDCRGLSLKRWVGMESRILGWSNHSLSVATGKGVKQRYRRKEVDGFLVENVELFLIHYIYLGKQSQGRPLRLKKQMEVLEVWIERRRWQLCFGDGRSELTEKWQHEEYTSGLKWRTSSETILHDYVFCLQPHSAAWFRCRAGVKLDFSALIF